MLSRISYMKLQFLATRIELRSAFNVLGLVSDLRAEEKNKKDMLAVTRLVCNLDAKDRKRLNRQASKSRKRS